MKSRGFTLIELLVVIAIIGLLSSVVFASLNSTRGKARDARRLSDMKQMQTALEFYYDKYDRYPDSDNLGCGSWDTSGPGAGETQGTFTTALVTEGFLPSHLKDPQSGKDGNCGNYRYFRYPAGYEGCDKSKGAFYVLGVVEMETSGNPHPASTGWSCGMNNWQNAGMEWVAGKYEQ